MCFSSILACKPILLATQNKNMIRKISIICLLWYQQVKMCICVSKLMEWRAQFILHDICSRQCCKVDLTLFLSFVLQQRDEPITPHPETQYCFKFRESSVMVECSGLLFAVDFSRQGSLFVDTNPDSILGGLYHGHRTKIKDTRASCAHRIVKRMKGKWGRECLDTFTQARIDLLTWNQLFTASVRNSDRRDGRPPTHWRAESFQSQNQF